MESYWRDGPRFFPGLEKKKQNHQVVIYRGSHPPLLTPYPPPPPPPPRRIRKQPAALHALDLEDTATGAIEKPQLTKKKEERKKERKIRKFKKKSNATPCWASPASMPRCISLGIALYQQATVLNHFQADRRADNSVANSGFVPSK